jgi:hypothetical protein
MWTWLYHMTPSSFERTEKSRVGEFFEVRRPGQAVKKAAFRALSSCYMMIGSCVWKHII